jgi:hypothetical protein
VLASAGLLNPADGTLNWQALEDRAEAVNECVTDPGARERLLAMDDAGPARNG